MDSKEAWFRFYEELNDFLELEQRKQEVLYLFTGQPAIKDSIEALGVPHTEVDLIIVNGRSVSFTYLLQDQDRVSVYPVFESIDITPIVHCRPATPAQDPIYTGCTPGRLGPIFAIVRV